MREARDNKPPPTHSPPQTLKSMQQAHPEMKYLGWKLLCKRRTTRAFVTGGTNALVGITILYTYIIIKIGEEGCFDHVLFLYCNNNNYYYFSYIR